MHQLSPWMVKCNNRSMGPLAIGIGINVSAYCSLRGSLTNELFTSKNRSILQLSYQQRRLQCTIPSKITKTEAEVYLKAYSIQSHKPTVLHPFSTYFELNPC